MKKLALLLVLAIIIVSVAGCESAKRSTKRNLQYMRDDAARAFGLDQPSSLHKRDNEPEDLYEPYRPLP